MSTNSYLLVEPYRDLKIGNERVAVQVLHEATVRTGSKYHFDHGPLNK